MSMTLECLQHSNLGGRAAFNEAMCPSPDFEIRLSVEAKRSTQNPGSAL